MIVLYNFQGSDPKMNLNLQLMVCAGSNETGEEENKRDRTVFIATMSAVAAGALMLILVALMLAAIMWRRRARGKEATTRSKEVRTSTLTSMCCLHVATDFRSSNS